MTKSSEDNKVTGLPSEVHYYHPIEFIQLTSKTKAFLELGLESLKGGFQNQLLVGHVVQFVQKNGLKGLTFFGRFKESYVEEIVSKFEAKGIDLNNLTSTSDFLNSDKLLELSDQVSIHKPDDPFMRAANIYSTSNYSMLHLLPFNRSVSRKHVAAIVKSVKLHGILSYPLVIYTDCIDGNFKYWIVDGQHRYGAFVKLGYPIYFTLYQPPSGEVITRRRIVKLIASVNNTSRAWNMGQYLKAWHSLGIEEYDIINSQYDKTKLAITVLLQAYSGYDRTRSTEMFKEGDFLITNKEQADQYVQYLSEFRSLLPKSSTLFSAFLEFFRGMPDYDNARMLKQLKKVRHSFVFESEKDLVVKQIRELYASVA